MSIIACGAEELNDSKTAQTWMPVFLAFESGAWLWWLTDREVFYVPLPQISHEKGRPHSDDGPALISLDWKEYFIHGVLVDEQIVLRPETQTIQQIKAESNEEVRRVRIERFGWERFLKDSGAKVRHQSRNERDAQDERLYRLDDGTQRFVCVDPSTGRRYALGVPDEIESCDQAQRWMSMGLDIYATHRS